ncbi:hypothetical protein CLU79DRAFT_727789 [Phycomyces nitens]|nr:hypothetical protein CLU79DRAFT_727789 [Phycomyces nitens]
MCMCIFMHSCGFSFVQFLFSLLYDLFVGLFARQKIYIIRFLFLFFGCCCCCWLWGLVHRDIDFHGCLDKSLLCWCGFGSLGDTCDGIGYLLERNPFLLLFCWSSVELCTLSH